MKKSLIIFIFKILKVKRLDYYRYKIILNTKKEIIVVTFRWEATNA